MNSLKRYVSAKCRLIDFFIASTQNKVSVVQYCILPLNHSTFSVFLPFSTHTIPRRPVSFNFHRPIENWKTLSPKIRQSLGQFISNPNQPNSVIYKDRAFELEALKASEVHQAMFLLAGYNDYDSGGWTLSELDKNVRHCIKEKSIKISRVRAKYEQWWLALIDSIGYSLSESDRKLFLEQYSFSHDWDKVIIIDPKDIKRWFEL